jgi:hypothetical protein
MNASDAIKASASIMRRRQQTMVHNAHAMQCLLASKKINLFQFSIARIINTDNQRKIVCGHFFKSRLSTGFFVRVLVPFTSCVSFFLFLSPSVYIVFYFFLSLSFFLFLSVALSFCSDSFFLNFGHLFHSNTQQYNFETFKVLKTFHLGEIRTHDFLCRWRRRWPLHRAAGTLRLCFLVFLSLCLFLYLCVSLAVCLVVFSKLLHHTYVHMYLCKKASRDFV